MYVARVVDCGEKFSDSGCASKLKREWVLVEVEVKVCEKATKKECISM